MGKSREISDLLMHTVPWTVHRDDGQFKRGDTLMVAPCYIRLGSKGVVRDNTELTAWNFSSNDEAASQMQGCHVIAAPTDCDAPQVCMVDGEADGDGLYLQLKKVGTKRQLKSDGAAILGIVVEHRRPFRTPQDRIKC